MKVLQIHNEYIYKGGEETVVEEEKNLLLKNNCKVYQLIRKHEETSSIKQKINIVKI